MEAPFPHIMRHALVILENGSRWPAWLDRQALDSVDLVTQRPGEDSAQLARRVVERLAHGEERPTTATLVCSAMGGTERNQSRAVLLRALLGSAIRVGGGHVTLAADGSQAQRRELGRLAATLGRDIQDEGTVSLRFRALARSVSAAPQRRVA